MEYLQANVAKAINRLHGRRGPLWQRRYSDEPVLDTDAMVDRVGYILANPATAHLVSQPNQWPGLTSIGELQGKAAPSFTFLDATAWHRAGRPQDRRPFHRTETLAVRRLPGLDHLDEPTYRKRLLDAVKGYAEDAASQRRRKGLQVMGWAKLRRVRPFDRPRKPKQSPRPLCHTTERSLWLAFKELVRNFVDAYRQAAERYRRGIVDVAFPRGSYPPSRYPAAKLAPP
jgi:hypothetical protein